MHSYRQQYIQKLLTLLIYLPFIWLGTGLCLLHEGRSIMTKVLIVAIVALLVKYRQSSWSLKSKSKQQRYTCLAMLAFILYLFGLQLYHGADEGLIRTIGLITIYYYLFPLNKFDNRWIIVALLLNAIGLSFIIYQNTYVQNIDRLVMDSILMNPIPFATYCMLAAISQIYYAFSVKSLPLKIILILSTFISVTGIVLTDTRGVALALFIICILFLINILLKKSKTFIALSFLGFSFILITLSITLHSSIETRYNQTKNEIEQIQKGNLNTSIGMRFQIWKSGLMTLSDYPILGIGSEHFRPEFEKQYKEDLISKDVLNFNPMHYHNQFVDMAVKNGFIGLILFLGIFIIFSAYNKVFNSLCLSNIYIISIFICSLTDVPFAHLSIVYLLLLLLIFSEANDNHHDDSLRQTSKNC